MSEQDHNNFLSSNIVLPLFSQVEFIIILSEGSQRAFLKICQNNTVEPAESQFKKCTQTWGFGHGMWWTIPYSLARPRVEIDEGWYTYI